MRALAIAATGMDAQQTNLEVIANNIANINTTGYKRARAEFTDLLYQTERMQGVPNRANQAIVPEGANIGLGVQTSAVRNIHTQGNLIETGNKLDVAIIGQGWFQIEAADGSTLYSRAGAFNKNADGNLVTVDGYNVIPNINIPTDAQDITITRTGQVTARIGNAADFTELGQLTIANFANEAGLKPLGDNLFSQTPASGAAVIGVPDDPSYGYIKQSYLEGSNVDAVKEITDLITAQRAYEMNSKVITTADEMASIVSKNLK
ncbi:MULTISPECIES: flagellar basal-body rod protein FlgG [Rhizobium/Agrobacterium group]|jgi:flagellar basal-body rod protein FlgG|uniref:Flagellar basal-body rod protein FlgG n=2 Tax=Rhizobium/Agrobacterium group TaxID=227290 RepID=A0A1B9V503_AGRTU|nr:MULTISPECIES: flagellar basal-body rod protein FlgG [Rhizobium/Agrobacterium group]AHK00411.1 flagellar basal-body rod protein FlgG [Agrobacterium tumefaciens LBA4213 (Ach5)]AKC06257.1 flagellar basal-body rod protein [Agrobacterium tumefaciens]EHJ98340.1 flagellar basal body rod protein FlgG [Agrobacterium tumefaciens 5A]MDP9559711.1 flagellar basal-body rod protein FlgG [Rhizobium nepotum]QDG92237.1 flagellar basal-body rod protein FlgG [Rhizobium sp. NIBRBAC000502774]